MRIFSFVVAMLFSGLLSAQYLSGETEENLRNHVAFLASDELEGRLTGTQGEQLALEYIQQAFESIGLEPAGTNNFIQAFDFTWKIKPEEDVYLRWELDGQQINAKAWPVNGSGDGELSAELLFMGFGINAPDAGYNDYEMIQDLGNRIVLIQLGEPEVSNPHADFSAWTALERARYAQRAGAAAVVFLPGPDKETLDKEINPRVSALPIPVWYAEEYPKEAKIAHLRTALHAETRTGHNVAGFINNGAAYTLILGAHYDHLGYGEVGSLHRGEPAIHNGADDNASGTALLIELARYLRTEGSKALNYLCIAFSGEELGLLGAKAFTAADLLPKYQSTAMFNMDMVGRLEEDGALIVNGAGTSPRWETLLDSLKPQHLKIKTTASGVGPSDHTAFYLEDMPVLHFFTGTHSDYHRPEDDADKLNYPGMVQVGDYMLRLVKSLPTKTPLAFSKTKAPEQTRSRFKVTLGVVPDYAWEGKGMKISGVSEGKPAAAAGLQKDDVIIGIGEHAVADIYGYMAALGKFNPGDETTVRVMRGEKELEFPLSF